MAIVQGDRELKARELKAEVPPIHRLTDEMEKLICNLRENVMALNLTFAPVLIPEDPEQPPINAERTTPMAPLEQWLRSQLMDIAFCNDRITDYMRRCQL